MDGSCNRGPVVSDGGVTRSAYECTDTWTASDPRLTGDASRPWSEDTYQTGAGVISAGIEAAYLRNEGGGWACRSEYVAKGATPGHDIMEGEFTCRGNGGYEGLTAVLVSTPRTERYALEFVGLVFSGGLPPVPEPPAAQ